MTDRVVLVAAALSGVGRAAAIVFNRNGARVVVSGRQDNEGETLAEQLHAVATQAEYVRADVRNGQNVRNLIECTIDRSGRLDAAVNSTGCERLPSAGLNRSSNSYVVTLQTRALAVILGGKHEFAKRRAFWSSDIVNLSSATRCMPAGRSIHAGIRPAAGPCEKMAELDLPVCGARVNAIARRPHRRNTAQPSKPAATSEEISEAILFVASDEASVITVQVLCSDGGKQTK